MKYLFLALVMSFFVRGAFAVDGKTAQSTNTKVDIAQMGKIDQKTLDIEPKKKEEIGLVNENHGIKIHVSCKLKDGREIKQGEAGYESCLQQTQLKNDSSGKPPAADVKVNFGN